MQNGLKTIAWTSMETTENTCESNFHSSEIY